MKILIFGANGQVGSAFAKETKKRDIEMVSFTHVEVDITDNKKVSSSIKSNRPTHIINAAAYNSVDRAEDDFENAYRINALGPANIAIAARESNAIFVHYSTDYVFDGEKTIDYTEEDKPNPLSVYAKSKLLGEEAVSYIWDKSYVIRTAWVFAPGGNNFISRIVKIARECNSMKFVNDQVCTPTFAKDIVNATYSILEKHAPFGIYHMAGSESCTPFEWARIVFEKAGINIDMEKVNGGSCHTRAKRPRRSVMANEKLKKFGIEMPSGIKRLDDYFNSVS